MKPTLIFIILGLLSLSISVGLYTVGMGDATIVLANAGVGAVLGAVTGYFYP